MRVATRASREDVARAARMLVARGFIDAFGHVSVRAEDALWITPTTPLGNLGSGEVLTRSLDHDDDDAQPPTPIEIAMHRALYRARPDVSAILRFHAPACVAWGVRGTVPPLLHGLGGLSGELEVYRDLQLVADGEAAAAVAGTLGRGDTLILQGNGALAVGATLQEAFVRAHFLEERCRVALAVAGRVAMPDEHLLNERAVHYDAELARATAWADALLGRRA